MVKKWLEVDIMSDIQGRIPLLLASLNFKVLGALWDWFGDIVMPPHALILGRRELSPIIKAMFFSLQALKHPDKKFRIGQSLKATVVGPESSRAFLCLSLIGGVRCRQEHMPCQTCLGCGAVGGLSPQKA